MPKMTPEEILELMRHEALLRQMPDAFQDLTPEKAQEVFDAAKTIQAVSGGETPEVAAWLEAAQALRDNDAYLNELGPMPLEEVYKHIPFDREQDVRNFKATRRLRNLATPSMDDVNKGVMDELLAELETPSTRDPDTDYSAAVDLMGAVHGAPTVPELKKSIRLARRKKWELPEIEELPEDPVAAERAKEEGGEGFSLKKLLASLPDAESVKNKTKEVVLSALDKVPSGTEIKEDAEAFLKKTLSKAPSAEKLKKETEGFLRKVMSKLSEDNYTTGALLALATVGAAAAALWASGKLRKKGKKKKEKSASYTTGDLNRKAVELGFEAGAAYAASLPQDVRFAMRNAVLRTRKPVRKAASLCSVYYVESKGNVKSASCADIHLSFIRGAIAGAAASLIK